MTTGDTCTLRVRRTDGEDVWWQDFEVPFEAGMTYLDALLWVRSEVDPNLGFDFACITNNSCKLCQARIDGKPAYLCAVRAEAGTHQLEPLVEERATFDLYQWRDGVW